MYYIFICYFLSAWNIFTYFAIKLFNIWLIFIFSFLKKNPKRQFLKGEENIFLNIHHLFSAYHNCAYSILSLFIYSNTTTTTKRRIFEIFSFIYFRNTKVVVVFYNFCCCCCCLFICVILINENLYECKKIYILKKEKEEEKISREASLNVYSQKVAQERSLIKFFYLKKWIEKKKITNYVMCMEYVCNDLNFTSFLIIIINYSQL